MLNGVDISSHQAGIRISELTDTSFVIVKTSGGIGYRNSHAQDMLDQAVKSGKLIGTYHYAREKSCKGSAKAEAAYYVESTKAYIGKAVLALDWEEECSLGPGWAKEWLDEVYRLTGVKPIVYTSQGVCAYYDWSAVRNAGYKLWLAQYASNNPLYGWQSVPWQSGSLGAWQSDRYVIHQYGTGYITGWANRIDMDLFYGNAADWQALASKSGAVTPVMPSQPSSNTVSADSIINIMMGWEGLSRAAQTHRPIIDIYNGHKPLAVGYTVTYWDDYCDTTVSAAFIKANAVNLIGGTECGVERHVQLFKKAGIWIEDGSIKPQKGDIIVFNWDENSQPNDGFADHIGIVYAVDNNRIYTIEGNSGNNGTVAKCSYPIGHGNIRGFARPKYGTDAKPVDTTPVVVPIQPSDHAQGQINKTPQWVGKITADVLNIRIWAGTEHPNLRSYPTLKNGTVVEVCDVVKDRSGADWYYIRINGSIYGFAYASYVGKVAQSTTGSTISAPNKTPRWVGRVNGDIVNVRKGAGTEYANLISYPVLGFGNLVDVCDTVKATNGDEWYYIRIDGKLGYKYGFIYNEFLDRA